METPERTELRRLADTYDLQDELRRGASTVAWLGRHRALGRDVSITVYRAGPEIDQGELAHLAADARLLSGARRDGVVPVVESRWLSHEALAVVRARVRGATLRHALDESGPLAPERTASVLRQIGASLEWARRQGVVHRTLSSETICFLQGSGRVLLSFSATPTDEGDGARPAPGSAAQDGPDRAGHDGVLLDRCSDAQTLGVLGWEMLTGRRPTSATREPLATLRPDVPPELAAIVDSALVCQPGGRDMELPRLMARLAALAPNAASTGAAEDEGLEGGAWPLPGEYATGGESSFARPAPARAVDDRAAGAAAAGLAGAAAAGLAGASAATQDFGRSAAPPPPAPQQPPARHHIAPSQPIPPTAWRPAPATVVPADPSDPAGTTARERPRRRQVATAGIGLMVLSLFVLFFVLSGGDGDDDSPARSTATKTAAVAQPAVDSATMGGEVAFGGDDLTVPGDDAAGGVPDSRTPATAATAPAPSSSAGASAPVPGTAGPVRGGSTGSSAATPAGRAPAARPPVPTTTPRTSAPRTTAAATPPAAAAPPTGATGLAACSSPAPSDQRTCLEAHLALSDVELNRAYLQLIADLREQAGVAPGVDPPSVQRLRTQQRNWLVQRDEQCRRQAGSEGAIWAPSRASCLGQISVRRANELWRRVEQVRQGG